MHQKNLIFRASLYLASAVVMLHVQHAQPEETVLKSADVLLKNGVVHDGTDAPAKIADVAIKDGKILAIGSLKVDQVGREVNCQGLIVVPGFIDLHNHSDSQIVDEKTNGNLNYLTQGCTTIVTGNCGSGPVDVGIYYDAIDKLGAGTNVLHLLPQGSLRSVVMGTVNRPPTNDELQRMRRHTAKAMKEGAWGMSTGLIYVPSSYADTDELVSLAKIVGEYDGIYVSHIRNEGIELLSSIDEALKIGRQAKIPVHVSHFKSSGQDAWGLVRQAADMIEAARKDGEKVTADQYPYTASSTSLEATLIPAWARAGGDQALLKRLDDPEVSQRVIAEITHELQRKNDGEPIRIARYASKPAWVGLNVSEIAKQENMSTLDVVLEITRNGGASIVNFGMSEDDVRYIMQLPWVATASDGRAYLPGPDRPHPRSYGTFSRKIGLYAIQENVIPLAAAIRSATSLPAEIIGLTDRGLLKSGYVADITVFDPQMFIDVATYENPHQHSQGVVHVFVNGVSAISDGKPTEALAGKAIRHPNSKRETQ